jgi:uncharacterized membrane protein (DUF485 family)
VSTPVSDDPRYGTDAPVHGSDVYDRIEETAEFRELRRRFRTFVFPMTAAFLVWYLLYVFLSAWARGFMAHKVFGNINVAFVFGLLQFVSTFLIAWAYSRYANDRLDPLSGEIRSRIDRGEVR